jgi:hypothetical protein
MKTTGIIGDQKESGPRVQQNLDAKEGVQLAVGS